MISLPATESKFLNRVAGIQAIVMLVGAALAVFIGQAEAKATLAGGAIALTNTLLMVWRMRKDRRNAEPDAQQQLRMFYRSALERFFVVATLLAAGLGPLKIMPLPLLGGFVLGQLTLVFTSILIRRIE